jgi:DnaJ-like protein
MEEPSINECFRLLKIRRGVDFAEVKQAYRKNLYKCHPDRFQERPELLPVAERKTKRLIQVYGVLERWYESNGGMDNTAANPPPPPGADAPPEDSPEEQQASNFKRRLAMGLAAAAVVAIVAALAWNFLIRPEEKALSLPVAGVKDADSPEADAPEAAPPAAVVSAKPTATPQAPPTQESKKADLSAMVAERDREQAEWVTAYMHDRETERDAAEKEWVEADAQYIRFERENASDIKAALDETAAQADQARKASAAAKEAFRAQQQLEVDALRSAYDDWLLARGREAVALVQSIRKRENSGIGAISDTEDPKEIFNFWTAGEAGAPEINIAAKTGVTVLQPDPRFFPHFRSNIFLYDPEGKVLETMMGAIVAKHDTLLKDVADRKAATDAALAGWDAAHPAAPAQLDAPLQRVMEGRASATRRVLKARAALEAANLAVSTVKANAAFGRSPAGIKWADRILAAREAPVLGQGNH